MKRYTTAKLILFSVALALGGCSSVPDSSAMAASPAPVPGPALVLSAQPDHLVFSGTRDGTGAGASAVQTVTLRNNSEAPAVVSGVGFGGSPEAFALVSPPAFPQTLAPGKSLSLSVRLLPGSAVGVLRTTLNVLDNAVAVGAVPLSGLRALGLEGDQEPTLAQIADALDYRVNVGSSNLLLGTGAGLIGDEVAAPLFERVSAAPVVLRPVARYSPDGPSAYGFFVPEDGAARTQVLGTMTVGGHQTLNPPLQAGSQGSFDPGSAAFGIYLAASSYAQQDTLTLDRLNTGPTRHAVRVYPLRDRAGQVIPGSYLLAFEPSANGDYQDAVFVLENVRPVAAK
ncbi:hypothetical protein [Deinococcus arenicola]|uniref:Choice-of-anchor D domain-containing protein n=1 Tax=Deinococcus arenicola TaxID=2994950 RepID=A0ABU4DSJ6_9DEIO|nr:hypothetical protein [Deinococcus sp. ZS9-10]MDV6375358.1 hypothetical protein [Deinococcus sp. ZS9-10]